MIHDEGLTNIKIAIIKRAADDYRTALLGGRVEHKSPQAARIDCESFFESEWFNQLTNIKGKYIMDKIKEELYHDGII